MSQPIDYSTGAPRRSKLAVAAFTCSAAAALLLAVAVIDGMTSTEPIGFLSLPISLAGTSLAIPAILRRRSRGGFSLAAVIISVAYWALVAAILIPKLSVSGR